MEPELHPFRLEALLAHREWVERAARALVFGDAAAEDLSQQMWLEVLERPPARTPGSPRGWLRSVLHFTAIDAGRAARTRRVHEEAAARDERVEDDPANVVAQAETLDRVVHAVLELEEPYRTTVLLRFFRDLPPRSIAAMQGVPVETVRTRLKRAMAQLRERLDAENGGDRRRWCLAFVPFLRRPESLASAAGGAAAFEVAGGLLMGAKTKAAVAAGVLLLLAGGWFLLSPGTGTPRLAKRTPESGSTDSAAATEAVTTEPALRSSPGAAASATEKVPGGGRVRGILVLPSGGQATVTVTRDGRPLTTRSIGDGAFSLAYDRQAADPASFLLEASGPGWKPQFLPLAAAECDVGRIRMFQGIRYGGRVEDAEGSPVAGVRVAFLWTYNVMGVSGPTGPDGRFAIPLEVETSLPSIPAGSPGAFGEIATILPLMRGKDMAAVPVDPAGFREEHILRIEPREGARIRLVDGEARSPLPGWQVLLKSVLGGGASMEHVHPVFDSGVTDALGVFEPLWMDGDTQVILEARHGARRFVAWLDRKAAKAAGTLDIPVPPEGKARMVALRVVREDGGSPGGDVEVHVGWRLGQKGPGGFFRGTTDARGEVSFEVAASDPAPPEPPVVTWARVVYLAADGRPIMEDVSVPDPRNGMPAPREAPLVVRLGGARNAEVTWFRIQEAETGRDLLPVRLYSSFGTNTSSAYLFGGCGLRDRLGHSVWPAFGVPWQGWRGEPIESLQVEAIVEGRMPRWFEIPVEEFVRARAASTPILLEFPRSDGDELRVAVVDAGGKARPGVVTTLSWVARGRPAGYWEKAAQCTTDGNGVSRFVLEDGDPGVKYRVVALDPATGEAGGILEPRSGEVTLRMEPPRPLSFRVTLPDGSIPSDLSVSVVDPCFVLPERVAKCSEDGLIEIPGVVAGLYELRIQGRGPPRPIPELEPGDLSGLPRDPTPPGADPGAARTTTWYGIRVPADRAGALLVLR